VPHCQRPWGRRMVVFTLALVVVLGSGLVVVRPAAAAVPSDPLALIPESMGAVAGINIPRLKKSILYARVFQAQVLPLLTAKGGEYFTRMVLGLDSVTLGVGDLAASGRSAQTLLVLQGKIEPTTFVRELTRRQEQKGKPGFVASTHRGVTVHDNADEKLAFALLGPGLMVLGTPELVRQSIDLLRGRGTAVRRGRRFAALLPSVRTDRGVWILAHVPPASSPMGPRVKVSRLAGWLDLDPSFGLDLRATTPSVADAQSALAQGNLRLDELRANQGVALMGLLPMLDQLRLTSEGPAVRLQWTLTSSQVQDLVTRLEGVVQSMKKGQGPTQPPLELAP
jgi:hypothetical protein